MHKVMHFDSHNRQFTYHMKGKQLEEVNSEKDLVSYRTAWVILTRRINF